MVDAFFHRLAGAARTDGADTGSADTGSAERLPATKHTAGPWDPGSQHGSPPAAMLGRACERLPSSTGAAMTVSRFTMDLLGPIPVGELTVSAEVTRPGRSVDLSRAEITDVETGRVAARAHVWRSSASTSAPSTVDAAPFAGPEAGATRAYPPDWHTSYLDAVEWSWIRGAVTDPGPTRPTGGS